MTPYRHQNKHGIWFDFPRYIQIHRSVLSGWTSCMVTPASYTERISENILTLNVSFQFTIDGYEVHVHKLGNITFTIDSNGAKIPHQVKTESFGYAAFNQAKGHSIRICSPHEYSYNPNYPWHNKPHRHDRDNSGEVITIYSEDDRPFRDKIKFGHKYLSGGKIIKIQYTQETWSHLSEFYLEVFKLP